VGFVFVVWFKWNSNRQSGFVGIFKKLIKEAVVIRVTECDGSWALIAVCD
jgi:hypothetical protein